jgi:hypothetical protein
MTRLSLAIPANRTLLRLALDEPVIASVQEESTIAFAKCLRDNATLTSLSLARHNIRDHGASWLSWALETNVSLSTIDLRGNQISVSGVSALAATLVNRSLATTITLDGNALASQWLAELDDALDRARAGSKAVARVTYTSHGAQVCHMILHSFTAVLFAQLMFIVLIIAFIIIYTKYSIYTTTRLNYCCSCSSCDCNVNNDIVHMLYIIRAPFS